ncbi:serine hydrolase domain-containing protein [Flavobacterium selenitireducens]|uniref:serine hydrolase domain-containing protein n=1 Tax=Flavobacterium selenitireducens TaxID=2722704 RepID=UPI00168A5D3D|nr:serine hydrolase domain-containing protein [Flavobacterium selenitireducens]MBD3582345.1 beta-lactamase family protein [Flavobacterium selenitireducens]
MKKSYIIPLLFLAATAFAQADAKFARIDSLLTSFNKHNKFMGSIALREGDKIVFAKAYGFSDIASRKLADTNTKYKVGSITKPFTAVLILQLVDENKIKLEDKLSKFFPKMRNAEKITVEMLLRHRTGIHEILADPVTTQNITRSHTRQEIVDRISGYASDFEPGDKYQYSNSNYILLGYIIEDVTKKSYAENIQKRIASKLKLTNTSMPDKIDFSGNDAISATFDANWHVTPEWSNTLAYSAGALVSTPSDLTIFIKALFDGKLVSAASLEKMKTIQEGYGLGLITLPFDSKTFYGHTGGIENFRSVVGYDPVSKFGASLSMNGDNYDRNLIMQGVLAIYYGKEYKFPDLTEFTVSEDILKKYVGTYASADFPLKITVTTQGGKLITQATGQSAFAVEAKSENRFEYRPAGIVLEFSDGKMNLKQSGLDINFIRE